MAFNSWILWKHVKTGKPKKGWIARQRLSQATFKDYIESANGYVESKSKKHRLLGDMTE